MVVDSIQTISDPAVSGIPGSIGQVRSCADVLAAMAKATQVPFILVSHMTKDGALAGPHALEHLVDTVIMVEGDRHHALRMLRAVKHRFGPTGELGLFEMTGDGLRAVTDPHRYLLGDRRGGVAGSVVLPALEGQRALLVEVQALMAPTQGPGPPRSAAQGIDAGRLSLVRAVLTRHARIGVGAVDLFASVVGGIRVVEPAADLALAVALTSAWCKVVVPDDVIIFGEVGLGGEVRQVPQAARRLAESHRVGFRRAIVPKATPEGPPGLDAWCASPPWFEAIWHVTREADEERQSYDQIDLSDWAEEEDGGNLELARELSDIKDGYDMDRRDVHRGDVHQRRHAPRRHAPRRHGSRRHAPRRQGPRRQGPRRQEPGRPGRLRRRSTTRRVPCARGGAVELAHCRRTRSGGAGPAPWREGLERVLQAKRGALIVVGDDASVLSGVHGRLPPRRQN